MIDDELISTKASVSVIVLFVIDNEDALSASVIVKSPDILVLAVVEFVPPVIVIISSIPPSSSEHATPNVISPISLSEVTVDAITLISPKL